MKTLKILALVFVSLIVIIGFTIFFAPDEAHIERKIIVQVPSKLIYQDLMVFKNFNTWNPWAAKDPKTTWIFSGPDFGVDAQMNWTSEVVGNGQMKIIKANYPNSVTYEMDFGYGSKPTASILLLETDQGTEVTWTYDEVNMSGFGKIMGLAMDKFLGPDYETGLQNLKTRMELIPDLEYEMEVMELSPYKYLSAVDTVSASQEFVSAKLAQTYGKLMSYIGNNSLEQTGAPIAIYTRADESGFSFIPGIPVDAVNVTDEALMIRETASGKVLRTVYYGAYEEMEPAYYQMESFIDFLNLKSNGNPWEEYITDPATESNTENWLTYIYWPVTLKE